MSVIRSVRKKASYEFQTGQNICQNMKSLHFSDRLKKNLTYITFTIHCSRYEYMTHHYRSSSELWIKTIEYLSKLLHIDIHLKLTRYVIKNKIKRVEINFFFWYKRVALKIKC